MKIAVIGGGLSGLSAAYQAHKDGHEVKLFEATDGLGGVVNTVLGEDGAVLEAGAESCLRSKPEMLDLVRELELESDIISTQPENLGSFIVRDGALHSIPLGLRLMAPSRYLPFLRSGLLSWPGKFRALLDLVLPTRESVLGAPEESLAQFVTRRLGVEVLHYLAQPMVAGIYGADPQMLSLDATMPLFQRMEREHGSVIRGLRNLGADTEATGARYTLFFSLKGGVGQVINALKAALPEESLRLGTRVDSLEPVDRGSENTAWNIRVRGGASVQYFDAVVLALPGPSASELLRPQFPEMSELLDQIVYRSAVTVNLSYPRAVYEERVPRAYGFIVPAQERRPILACTFSSWKWENRGSEERGVLRTYFGGPSMDWAINAQDEELIAISKSQLRQLLDLDEEPSEALVHRWPIGLPEYRVGHRERIQNLKNLSDAYPTLGLAGNYLDGVGMPDCVRVGRKAVRQMRPLLHV